jgi:hypothetical protein
VGKGSYFAAIAANGHGTPPAPAGARMIVKEQTALGIGAKPKARAGALSNNLRPRPSHRGQQPVKASLPRHEFDLPDTVVSDEFVVSLGNAQYFVHRRYPFDSNPVFSDHGEENPAQGRTELPGFQEQGFGSPRIGLWEAEKLGATFSGDNARGL